MESKGKTKKSQIAKKVPKNCGESKFGGIDWGRDPNICYVYLSQAHVDFLEGCKKGFDFVNNIVNFFRKFFKGLDKFLDQIAEAVDSFLEGLTEAIDNIAPFFDTVNAILPPMGTILKYLWEVFKTAGKLAKFAG